MMQTATIKATCQTCENFLAAYSACEGLPEADQPFKPVCYVPAESHPIADADAFGVGVGDDETRQVQPATTAPPEPWPSHYPVPGDPREVSPRLAPPAAGPIADGNANVIDSHHHNQG